MDDVDDLNIEEPSIISRYITNPLLINGYKFDLRIYVVITCYEPLRIYVYKEGLARFASETYTAKFNKNNKGASQKSFEQISLLHEESETHTARLRRTSTLHGSKTDVRQRKRESDNQIQHRRFCR